MGYYFQNMDDGKYLTVEYKAESIDHHRSRSFSRYFYDDPPDHRLSLHFKDSESEATLFRLKEFPFEYKLDFDLKMGSRVNFGRYSYSMKSAQIIAVKYSDFGKEVQLKYDGMSGPDGVSEWIPALNDMISRYDPERVHWRYSRYHPMNEWVDDGADREIGDLRVCDDDLNVMEDERYKKRVKSRKKMKSRKRKRGHYREWNVDDKRSLKRIDRKMRKYGQIPKYT